MKTTSQCKSLYEDLKKRQKYKYIIYKIDTQKLLIEPLVMGAPGSTYAQFLEDLQGAGCCYAVYDFSVTLPEGGVREKIVFYNW